MAIAWAPLEWLLRYVLADDSFYYFTIARNFAHGYGLSFDRLAETNGFHPLWMMIILPVYALIEDRTLAVHAVLTICALMDVLSIYLLYKLLDEFGIGEFAKGIVCFLYAFAPALVSHVGPMNGLETALNLLFTLLYLLVYRRAVAREALPLRSALRLGLVTGLLFLARTDNIILLASTYAYLALVLRPRLRTIQNLYWAGTLGAVIAAPWLLWSYQKFGSIVQVSGLSVAFMLRTIVYEQGWTAVNYITQFIGNLANLATFVPFYLYDTRALSLIPVGIVALLVALTIEALKAYRRSDSEQRSRWIQNAKPLLAPLAASILFVLVHTVRGVYMRGWYYMSLVPILLVALGILLDGWARGHDRLDSGRRTFGRALLVTATLAMFILALSTLLKPRYGEIDKFRLVQAMNVILPPGVRVGSWNAGVYGYFFEKGTVVGLDGLVNNEAYPYITGRSLAGYCKEKQITYLADPVGSLQFVQRFWSKDDLDIVGSLSVVYSIHGNKEGSRMVVGRLTR